ncbi:Gfo/Idh/MocA family oxidoreductase [Flectobacillus roseus]|uniref:Gfo/Idh/MocA family oxidoreductase n=1 Tax=Flectobacillus roseus TaxID=502259 RepID=UPI0024B82DF2|nr:Gfo/Idh/MocA family oxidoreductase [Flectobacillus roseus]MDI9870215.1 Gfo/Idh/MocA family oxidoreductase [Flectobacillus roseus]
MINIALVGFGLSGRYLQAPFITANSNYHLKTIVTSNALAKELYPDVQIVSSIEDVLADSTIDLVSIASPNATHYEYAKKALLANKHVLVEKPLASTSQEAEELILLAKQQNKVLSVFQNRRFDSDFLTVQKILKAKLLGDIVSYEVRYDRYKPVLNPKKWKETPSPGSGIIYDLGPHILDQALVLFGVPQKVWGQTYTQREGSLIDDAFDIYLSYDKMTVKLSSSLLVREESPRYRINGTKGSFVKYGIDHQEDHLKADLLPQMAGFGVEPIENQGAIYSNIGDVVVKGKVETEVGNWGLLFQNLYEAIAEGKELLIKPELVLEQIKIIEAVKQL